MSEGVVIGVRKPHIAIMRNPERETEYDTPLSLGKAINLKVKPKVNSATLYADDGPSENSSALGEIEVEIEVDKLVSDKKALILGSKKDANGVLIESSDDKPPYLALGFQVPTTLGMKYSWLYKGKFELMEEDYKTQADKVDYQTPKAKATFLKRASDNRWKASVVEGDPGVTKSILDNWFKAVYEENIDLSELNVTVDTGATDIKFTFNKAIKPNTVNDMSIFLMKSDGSIATTTTSIDTTSKIVTLHPINDLETGSYIVVCTTEVKDITNLSLVQNAITTFTV